MVDSEYSAKDIMVLSGPQGVRKRPAMYIGSTGSPGFIHLLYEVLDNAIDECMAGYAKSVTIKLGREEDVDVAEVTDDGRGIPVDIIPKVGKPALEVIMTSLHSGGKFENKAYKVSGGLHGVGLTVVNSLSEYTEVTVKRDGKVYRQRFSRGGVTSAMEMIGESNENGTTVKFKPDKEIFSARNFDTIELIERLRDLSYLNPGLKINLIDERETPPKTSEYFSKNGFVDFLSYLKGNKKEVSKPLMIVRQNDGLKLELAVQYIEGYTEDVLSFVNKIKTPQGGTHVNGFHVAITRALAYYNQKISKKSRDIKLESEDTREGLNSIISILMPNPEFEGQTKEKLGNTMIKSFVENAVYQELLRFLEENPSEALKIIDKVYGAAEAREAARKARELARKKGLFEGAVLPGKLADCTESDPAKSEIFIVEGESAAGCFAGDVEIALTDGRNLSFRALVEEAEKGKENFCYTIKDNGGVGIQKIINARLTKKNADVIKITLDNNQEIICTPNHEFMLRDGSYKMARDLKKEDSLMPFHKRISKIGGRITIDGYEMVWNQNKTWIFTHMLADEYNLQNRVYTEGQGNTRHHMDFNKLNNNPSNITRITKESHINLHAQHADKILHSPAVKEKAALAHQSAEYRDKVKEWANKPEVKKVMSSNSKKLWENVEYKEYMKQQFLDFYNSNEDYRNRNAALLYKNQEAYWSNPVNRRRASERVKKFFESNPSYKKYLSESAIEQWKDNGLLAWRRQKTKEQWTPEFRQRRKEAYNRTYYYKTINLMKSVLELYGNLKQFDLIRINNRDKSVLSVKEFCSRFFNCNTERMIETVNNYNHKIKKIEWQERKTDVYDIEVPETHNFALASGIFVHNSSKQARDRFYQAILPLRGKILNVEKATEDRIFNNAELHTMVTAFGTGIKDTFNPDNIRYGKIILLTDADVDGSHIRTLLLTFFYRFMRQLIERGNIYIGLPPLYKVSKGREVKYAYSDQELNEIMKGHDGKASIQRYKGLGEMNPEQLWETTMDPKVRKLKKVTIGDAELANTMFTILMGLDVEQRRHFIEEHSSEVKFLDI